MFLLLQLLLLGLAALTGGTPVAAAEATFVGPESVATSAVRGAVGHGSALVHETEAEEDEESESSASSVDGFGPTENANSSEATRLTADELPLAHAPNAQRSRAPPADAGPV